MSRVTDVLLIFSVGELFDKDLQEFEAVPALVGIRAWFEGKGCGMLDSLDEHAVSGGKVTTPYG